jgi:hypothetical protein
MKAVNTVVSNEKREKRAKSIAAMGLVTREDGLFLVTTPSLKGQAKTFQVDKNDHGSIRCTCAEFNNEIKVNASFRCEHILAVKFYLTGKTMPSAVPTPTDTVTSANNISATEPLKPESDEQGMEKVDDVVETNGQVSMEEHTPDPLANTKGELEMKQETLTEPEIEIVDNDVESSDSNVLDFSSTLKELRRHVDPKLVKQREGWRDRNGRVQMVDYVEWHTVADILDETAPNWTHTIKDIRPIGDFMTVTAAITIDGVTREGVGTGLANSEMGIKKAEHDALKRAAVKFGIARDLYKKESDVIEREGASFTDNNDGGFPSNPMASNLSDQVTAKQLGMIKAIAREIGIDADEECRSLLQSTIDELSKRAASQFIKHLQDTQRTAEPPAQIPFRRAS